MIGLIMRFEGRTKNIIKELLNDFKYDEYEFDISHWESFGDDVSTPKCDFNEMDVISSVLIKNKIFAENNKINPEFMEFYVRKIGTKSKNVYYYKDFLESDYFLSIINCDYRNIEVFSKDSKLLEKIKKNYLLLDLNNKTIKEIQQINPNAILQAWEFGKGIEY